VVGERHLKLTLERDGRRYDAIFFRQQELLPPRIRAVFELQTNQYNGQSSIQLCLRHWQPVS
jgi:single-stranded-DNA-specific exonuclease